MRGADVAKAVVDGERDRVGAGAEWAEGACGRVDLDRGAAVDAEDVVDDAVAAARVGVAGAGA